MLSGYAGQRAVDRWLCVVLPTLPQPHQAPSTGALHLLNIHVPTVAGMCPGIGAGCGLHTPLELCGGLGDPSLFAPPLGLLALGAQLSLVSLSHILLTSLGSLDGKGQSLDKAWGCGGTSPVGSTPRGRCLSLFLLHPRPAGRGARFPGQHCWELCSEPWLRAACWGLLARTAWERRSLF